ncbi:hypothetical protein AURDEDRAFT_171034 [Auricularia subglabra TFB-10046 SS5]|nr:hypothetical protein AURDEDRAFT_171034 [Auricularia subglabra TFB-10046 SS5]
MPRDPPNSYNTELDRAAWLPTELVTMVLEHLPQDDLRRASTASKAFYLAAHATGLELHRTITNFYPTAVTTFVEIVQHAAAKGMLFRIALTLTVRCNSKNRSVFVLPMQNILSAVTAALPFLTSLRAGFPGHFAEMVYAALSDPAPLLHTLEVAQCDSSDAAPVRIPANIFAGAPSPCLRTVTLRVPALKPAWAPIAAFEGVRFVNLEINCAGRFDEVAVGRFFPSVTNLHILATRGGHSEQCGSFIDVSALRLHRLIVDNVADCLLMFHFAPRSRGSSATAPAGPPHIASIDYTCQTVMLHTILKLWPENIGELNAQIQSGHAFGGAADVKPDLLQRDWPRPPLIQGNEALSTCPATMIATISSADLSWRQAVYTQPNPSTTTMITPLDELVRLHTCLVSLTVDESLLLQLVETPRKLHALRELYLDFTIFPKVPRAKQFPKWTRDSEPIFGLLGCPALERVTVFATNTAPVTVGARKIASFGRLLLGVDQLSPPSVELLLMHARLDKVKDSVGLEEIFSPIRMDASDRPTFPAYFRRRD